MIKSLKIHKASWSVFSNSVFISMETEMAAWSLLQGCNYSCSSQQQLQLPVRAWASPKACYDLAPSGKLKKGKALGSEWNLPCHNNITQIHTWSFGEEGQLPFSISSACNVLKNDFGMGGQRNWEGQCRVRAGVRVVSGSAGPSLARYILWKGFADGSCPGGTERCHECPCWSQALQKQWPCVWCIV